MKFILAALAVATVIALSSQTTAPPEKEAGDPSKRSQAVKGDCCGTLGPLSESVVIFVRVGKSEVIPIKSYMQLWSIYAWHRIESVPRILTASWYGPRFHRKKTCHGERFNMYNLTAAHKELPAGTMLTLRNPKNGKKTSVRITDCGPYIEGRELDLSFRAARELGFVKTGVTELIVEEVSFPAPKKK
ncbi:MAG: septal ring lytic transglycosylase RlpA family protein [Candidatus Sungiibacteriota bacterium]|uniref:Probable endolytic peptidoglycan transglycosylase RlpA n=1 Tax=Candidatus Sungiibacteriota bacterium TaxID=2750080 RepID=A0A7T5UQZ9_9BACT|nr:MAG: septal ring lytic transglycosylase RlpA family protein [Candidatus Sungbacteria bacterium]